MMKNRLLIFLLSLVVLAVFVFIALLASMVFSIRRATTPIRLTGSKNIAVLEIKGIIMSSARVTEKIAKLKEEEGVRAIVVRINSPGGAVGPSQEIHAELKKLGKKIPVFASLGTIATSGGYYIAAACEKIFSNPGTLTGSIGVMMNFVNLERVYDYLKLEHSVIKSGKFKDIGSASRKISSGEKKLLQGLIDDTFNQFKKAILSNRKLPGKTIKLISDGRILTGLQAKKLGLVDKIGTLQDTIEEITKAAKIQGKPEIIYPLRKKEKFIEYILDYSISNIIGNLKNHFRPGGLLFLPDKLVEVLYENN